jgi:hypothetical protein
MAEHSKVNRKKWVVLVARHRQSLNSKRNPPVFKGGNWSFASPPVENFYDISTMLTLINIQLFCRHTHLSFFV